MGENITHPSDFSTMEKQVLRLVRNNSTFYVPSIKDYEVLKGMGVPLLKVDVTELPLLKSRCKRKSIRLKVKEFEVFERLLFKKINERWEFPIVIKGNTLYFDIPRKKSIYRRAQGLVNALTGFYNRHMYDTEVKTRKFSKKVRFIIELSFNDQRQPEWKDNGKR